MKIVASRGSAVCTRHLGTSVGPEDESERGLSCSKWVDFPSSEQLDGAFLENVSFRQTSKLEGVGAEIRE